jgi:cobalt-zinc-cadmium efflux system outer membrane protein
VDPFCGHGTVLAVSNAMGLDSIGVELGGKRARRIALGEATVRAGAADLDALVAAVRADVRRGYFETVVAAQRLIVLDDARGIADRAAATAKARFDDGDVPYLDVLQAELALAAADADVLTARGAVAAAWAKLNALLGQPSDRVQPLATAPDASRAITAAAALEQARGHGTELAALDRRIDEQRARVALARAMRVPDVAPTATLTHDAEPEFTYGWRAGVTVTVPLFTTHRAGIVLEDATLAQLQAQRTALLQRLEGDVAAAAASAEAQRQAYLRYHDVIVPKAEQVERMALESFQSGQTGLPALLQAFQATRDVRLRSLDAMGQFQAAVADLERTMGAPLP